MIRSQNRSLSHQRLLLAGLGGLAIALLLGAGQSPDPAPAAPAPIARGFLYRTMTLDGKTVAYNLFVPPSYSPDRNWPTILFLHGSGERGSDGFFQTDVGIAHAIRRNHTLVPALVVMPQCPSNAIWNKPDSAKMALACVEDVSRDYKVDASRIYLTGLSMGGRGCWFLAARVRNAFAAMVPICGGGDPADAAKLTEIPIWAWHGSADKNVPISETEAIVEAIKAAGGKIEFSRIPGGEHNVWDRAYGDAKLWQWLFAQQLPEKGKTKSK